MFQIISDSACDLSQKYVEEHKVKIVSLSMSFDGENYYKDRLEVNRDDFYQQMVDDSTKFPKTSLPSVDEYMEAFKEFTNQGIPVVCFTISLALSGSYNSARTAKEMLEEEDPNAKITVINSEQNTVTQALIVDQIVRMRDAGLSFEEVNEKLPALMTSARIIFTVGSLDYLKMGGRIGKVAVAATSKLGVKPIIIMKDGEIGLGGIGRNRNKLKKQLITIADKYVSEKGKDNYIFSVGYGYDKEEGLNFMKDVEEGLDIKLNEETNVAIGPVSATHTGPYPIGIGVIQKYETI